MLQDLLLLCGTANPHQSPGGALGNSCACKGLSCSFSRVVQRDMGLWGFRAPKKAAKWATKNSPFRSLPASPPPRPVPPPPRVPCTLRIDILNIEVPKGSIYELSDCVRGSEDEGRMGGMVRA